MRKKGKAKSGAAEQGLGELLERYRSYLTAHQLKYTSQREVIISEFVKAGGHLSAEDLFRIVKRKAAGVGLASVYRTISSLVEAGLAVERRFGNRTSLFELETSGHHHDHLICLRCGKIFEFQNEEIEALQRKVAEGMGFELRDHKLELNGWCQRQDCPELKR